MNDIPGLVFDFLLAVILLRVAWRLLSSSDLFRAVVLFIAFGLLLAIAWVRLDAPDVALAEAAIGAGVTGALLLIALARMAEIRHSATELAERLAVLRRGRFRITIRPVLLILVTILGVMLLSTLLVMQPGEGLQPAVAERLGESGVDHPVTAVLLNFRAWDTLLELSVLLLAVLGVWSLRRHAPLPVRAVPGPVMPGMVRLLLPVAVVIGFYLLWLGAHAPGGAFQAGAIFGAAGVLWILSRPRDLPIPPAAVVRLGVSAGVLLFFAIGVAGLLGGFGYLGYPPPWSGMLILVIEVTATLSIGLTLVALFLGGAPRGEPSGDHNGRLS